MTSPHVIEVTEATFLQEVMQRSRTTPVLLDVWAAWCGPCQVLGPVLEKVVAARRGQVVLAKLDADQAPNVTSALGITSLPTVALFLDGQPVDGFVGAQPERAVNAFLDRHLPPLDEQGAEAGAGADAGPEGAHEHGPGCAHDPDHGHDHGHDDGHDDGLDHGHDDGHGHDHGPAQGRGPLPGTVERGAPGAAPAAGEAPPPPPDPVAQADAWLRHGEVARARQAAENLVAQAKPPAGARLLAARAALFAGDEAALTQHVAALEPDSSEARRGAQLIEAQRLLALGRSAGPAALERAAQRPDDLEARYLAGLSHVAAGRVREGFEALLEVVTRDKRWNEQAARKALVAFFALRGDADPLVDQVRKRLVIVL